MSAIHLRARATIVLFAMVAAVVAGCAGSSAPTPALQTSAEAGSRPATTAAPAAGAAFPDEIAVAAAARERDAGAFILDVREPDEWAAGHIPGATSIPLGQLAGRTAEVPTDRDIFVVCKTGYRSAQGRDILRAAGLTRVASMAGGMNAWIAAGNPTTTGE